MNGLDGRVIHKAHTQLLGHIRQGLDAFIHAAFGIPDAFSQLSVLQQGISGRGVIRAETQVHILEGESGLQALILKEAAGIGVMLHEGFELEKQRQIRQAEILKDIVEISAHEFFQRDLVVLAAFRDVAQKTLESGLLDSFQLLLHITQVGGELKLQAVIKVHLVGGVDACELQMIAHFFTQGGESFFPDLGHQEQGWTDIKAMPIAHDLTAAPAGDAVLFQNSYRKTIASQAGGGSDTTDPGANYDS